MKKLNKKDLINLLILTVLFISVIFYILRNGTLYGSILDWNNQHSVIPEYFRTLFYKTHNILPNFALNLGSGQNIYNYAYYGFLSPIILISYLLPFITMKTYIQISSILVVYSSIILFYYFLRLNKYNEKVSLLGSFAFLTSMPLLLHSHRHIMFINYFPFLILALIGVNKYFDSGNRKLLCISVILIIFTSYYYSIPSIICIVIYGIYKYLMLNKKITFKKFINDGFKFVVPIIVAILISCVLLVPTFLSLLGGRNGTSVNIDLTSLIIPKINVGYLMYNHYGIGLTAFSLIGLAMMIFYKKREDIFLFICLSLMILFPVVNYILNAGMYIDSKVLIPFIPLYILIIVKLFNNVMDGKLNYKHLIISSVIILFLIYIFKTEYKMLFYIDYVLSLVLITICNEFELKKTFYLITIIAYIGILFSTSNIDNLVKYNRVYNDSNNNQKELSKLIENDYNRTALYNNNHDNVNEIYGNLNIYSNYIYSSIGNTLYNKFYYDVFENNMPYRNRSLLVSNTNIMYLMFSNTKYFISDEIDIIGYEEKNRIGSTVLYENNDVLPYMYVSYNFMNEKDFNNYSFPYNNEILLNNVIIKSDSNNNYETKIKEASISEFPIKEKSEFINWNDHIINVSKKNSSLVLNVKDKYKDKILFISFNVDPQNRDLTIDINGVTNKLTNKNWKYYNGNLTFNYVISESNKDELTFTFGKGVYNLNDIKIYYLDYNDIKNIKNNVTKVNIKSALGDKIIGNVEAIEDGYFVTTIPYDKGFNIKVDGKSIDSAIINSAFLGFKISKGYHDIEISYRSPGKLIGIILSLIGIILYIFAVQKNVNAV